MDEIAALRAQVAALQSRLDAFERQPSTPHRPVRQHEPAWRAPGAGDAQARSRPSRRRLLTGALAGGAGLVATQVTSAAPAVAAPGGNLVLGATNDAGTASTTVTAVPSSFTPVLLGQCTNNGTGVSGRSGSGWGVDARSGSGTGLAAQSGTGPAVDAYSDSGAYCVYVRAGSGVGVAAFADGSAPAVRAQSAIAGAGVLGLSKFGAGVHGQSANGVAVRAESGTDPTGVNPGPGSDAVLATAVAGTAVNATSTGGYGVLAKGGRAPLRLVPSTRTGPPVGGAHGLGELVVDKTGALYLCTAAGTPGTWGRVVVQ